MPLNLELRFKLDNASRVERLLRAVAPEDPISLEQEDTFFNVRKGRLLLRREDDHAELIFYSRRDAPEARPSAYFRHPVEDPDAAEARLGQKFGVRERVRKQRLMFSTPSVQICLDTVSPLGDFLDVRVPIDGAKDLPRAHVAVRRMIDDLELGEEERVSKDYDELLGEELGNE